MEFYFIDKLMAFLPPAKGKNSILLILSSIQVEAKDQFKKLIKSQFHNDSSFSSYSSGVDKNLKCCQFRAI